jgi:poly(hydroxyalkanoate) depolymerase family esterase
MNNLLLEATRLTRASRLTEATAVIQRMLQGETGQLNASATQFARWKHSSDEKWRQDFGPDAQNQFVWGLQNLTDSFPDYAKLKSAPHAGFSPSDLVPEGGTFVDAHYANSAGSRSYKLYVPSCYNGQKLPLIIMLHGGTQTADDFAGGTRMNVRAEEDSCLVAYPIQPGHANLSKCWNWFRPEDQCRDRGEPSLIAGITRQIMKDYSVDPGRVYVAGFSAGGAAAAVLTATYPDLYAATGVHSGLAFGTAGDVVSAFAAMRGDCSKQYRPFAFAKEAVPTIVFHGENDRIVHPANAEEIVGSIKVIASRTDVRRGQVSGGRAYTCTSYITTDGQVVVEDWRIDGAGHAWSGGHPAGSYTDARGPDAAKEMLRFFRGHVLTSRVVKAEEPDRS